MATWNTRTVLALATSAFLTVGIVVSGCSSSSSSEASPEAGTSCPANFDAANQKSCNTEGLTCSFQYYCTGNLYQNANCTCTGGKFSCLDQSNPGSQTPIAAGAEPQCLVNKPGTEACPSTFASTDGVSCKTSGKICPFAGAVCNGIQLNDICQCVAGGNGSSAADGGLAYKCEKTICNLDGGAAVDSGTIQDASDGG